MLFDCEKTRCIDVGGLFGLLSICHKNDSSKDRAPLKDVDFPLLTKYPCPKSFKTITQFPVSRPAFSNMKEQGPFKSPLIKNVKTCPFWQSKG